MRQVDIIHINPELCCKIGGEIERKMPIMKPGLKVIVTRSEIQSRYQSTKSEHFYTVLMVDYMFFSKKILFVAIYFIFQTLRIQYTQFGIKKFYFWYSSIPNNRVPWNKRVGLTVFELKIIV